MKGSMSHTLLKPITKYADKSTHLRKLKIITAVFLCTAIIFSQATSVAASDILGEILSMYLPQSAGKVDRSLDPDVALLTLYSFDFADTKRTAKQLREVGARAVHIIPPNSIIATVPQDRENMVRSLPNVASLTRRPVQVLASAGTAPSPGIAAWNNLRSPENTETLQPGSPLVGEAYYAPSPITISSSSLSSEPGYYQTSEYMMGEVAVGVVLPESQGSAENWSATRQNEVFSKIVEGLDWWAMRGGDAASLTFIYDKQFGVPTQYEPIQMTGTTDQSTWVRDIFENMGYTWNGTHYNQVRDYVNDIRADYSTDWAYSIIVVDSLNDADGRFGNGYFAWATMGGPYFVMTYDNDGWGIGRMNNVTSHETGHIFLAADQYCQGSYACCSFNYYGYLNVYNGNCEKDNPNSVPCIMRYNEDALEPYTKGQIGWRDSDGNGIFDPVDTETTNILDAPVVYEAYASFTGSASIIPCESPTRTEVAIGEITNVQFRVDDGAWTDALPSDGAFDSLDETYYFDTPVLAGGDHVVQTKVINRFGAESDYAQRTITIAGGTETPVFDPAGGTYNTPVSVSMQSGTPGATIRYTTDGTDPTENSATYSAPISISENTTLKAKAWADGLPASSVTSASYNLTCDAPVFNPSGGQYTQTQYVSISSPTTDAIIRFTTDGSEPTEASNIYFAPIPVSSTTTIKAMATKTGWDASTTSQATYEFNQVETPTLTPLGGQYTDTQYVSMNCETVGATIRYTTDGSDPTETSNIYSSQIAVSDTTTVKARAFLDGYIPSGIAFATYEFYTVATPVITPSGGTFQSAQTVQITCDTTGAVVRYTTDGTTPTESSTQYIAPFEVSDDTTVKAKAFKTDYVASATASAVFVIEPPVADPIFTPAGGDYTEPVNVSINCGTAGATIRYTTDGSTPTESSTLYTGAITIDSTTTLKAKAWKDGYAPSGVTSGDYVITQTVETPYLSPQPGNYGSTVNVQIICDTPESVIYFTTDGSEPDVTDNIYTGSFAIDSTTTVKAKAYRDGWTPSGTVSGTYVFEQVATPVITPSGGTFQSAQTVQITCDTTGAVVRYTTDGTTPTESSTQYIAPFEVSDDTTVKAKAFKTDYVASATASAVFVIEPPVADPIFTPAGGDYTGPVNVSISCGTAGATIRYTTDGSTPTETSALYTGAITIDSTTTLKAKAWKDGYAPSGVTSAEYLFTDKVGTVTFTPAPGNYVWPVEVRMSSSTSGVTIRYTTDGSEPGTGSPIYVGPVYTTQTTTFKAKAYKYGMTPSDVATGTYQFDQVDTPVCTPSGGEYIQPVDVVITCATENAEIRYTTNGNTPTAYSTLYTGPIHLESTTTIKARAFADGLTASNVETEYYTFNLIAEEPVFTPAGGTYTDAISVQISSSTPGAQIRYTIDGSTPTESSTLYSAPIAVSTTTTIKARTFAEGYTPSAIVTENYVYQDKVAAVTFVPEGGAFNWPLEVRMRSATPGVTIRYSRDGSEPGTGSPIYVGPVYVTDTTTFRARAFKSGMTPSDITSATYQFDKVDTPVCTPAGGEYVSPVDVTISCATSGAEIRYTTNGLTPTESSTLYTGPIHMESTTTLKVRAFMDNLTPSDVRTESYTFNIVAAQPDFTPAGGNYTGPVNVTLSSQTPGAQIRYTTDGSTPTESSTLYSAPIAVSTTTTIKARTFADGFTPSAVATESYVYQDKIAAVTFEPEGGVFVWPLEVRMRSATPGVTIRYTTDGSEPGTGSPIYVGPVYTTKTTTFRARAYKSGLTPSDITSATYTYNKVETPVFTPVGGTYAGPLSVSISCGTPDVVIRYTTNGNTPTIYSQEYTGPFDVSSSTVVRAKAWKADWATSDTATTLYSFTE